MLVATVKALKHHAGDPDGGLDAIERGAANLARHLGIIREFGLNAVVARQPLPRRHDEEIELVRKLALEHGAYAAEINDGVRRRAARARPRSPRRSSRRPTSRTRFDFLYPLDAPIEEKIEAIAKRVYGADGIFLLHDRARQDPAVQRRPGFDKLPICMAKTHLSLSHDPALANAPTGFTVTIRDIRAYTGAGWLVALCGDMQTMPGLGKTPGGVQRRHRRARAGRLASSDRE